MPGSRTLNMRTVHVAGADWSQRIVHASIAWLVCSTSHGRMCRMGRADMQHVAWPHVSHGAREHAARRMAACVAWGARTCSTWHGRMCCMARAEHCTDAKTCQRRMQGMQHCAAAQDSRGTWGVHHRCHACTIHVPCLLPHLLVRRPLGHGGVLGRTARTQPECLVQVAAHAHPAQDVDKERRAVVQVVTWQVPMSNALEDAGRSKRQSRRDDTLV
eukprot:364491-Chlamydomonas_euryale.AAC.7